MSSSAIANHDVFITIREGLRRVLAYLGFACGNFARKNKRLLAVFSISEIDSQRCHATQCSSRSITFFVWRVCKSGDSRLRIICNFSIRCCLVRNQIMEGDGLLKKVTLNDGHKMPLFGLGVFTFLVKGESLPAAKCALRTGYRMIDTAAYYE